MRNRLQAGIRGISSPMSASGRRTAGGWFTICVLTARSFPEPGSSGSMSIPAKSSGFISPPTVPAAGLAVAGGA